LAHAEEGAALWAMAHLATPMAVRVAATLRIADHISEGVRTAPELAATVNADADALERVMRHLTMKGVLTCDDGEGYGLTSRGEALREDHPAGMRALLDMEGTIGRADLAFAQLLHSVRTGEAGFPRQFGLNFWDDIAADPSRSAVFYQQMNADITAWAPAILSSYDWGSLGHIVDVGGGDGSLLIALLAEYPALRGTIVDLPAATDAAAKALEAAGLADRSDVVAGSFFDPLPPGAGGYLLAQIIHDWGDEEARAILRRCAEAAGPHSPIILVERTGGDGDSLHAGMDLRMLVFFGGRERSVAQITELAADEGLRVAAVHHVGPVSVIELRAT
jgi:hypothetical protein